jgi:hypothetical protein
MPRRVRAPDNDEQQGLLNCCKVLLVALFGWFAIRVALLPFEQGAFTPSNPALLLNGNSSSVFDVDESKQRIVLILGQHEALQRNLLEWSRSPVVLPNWAFPIPTREELKAFHFNAPPRFLSFDPLFSTLHNDASYYEFDKVNGRAILSIIELYRNKTQKAWSAGKSIVIASKDATHLQDPRVMGLWLKTLPRGVKVEDVHVVITYPTPRSHQLIRVWSSERDPNATTLTDFIGTKLNQELARVNPLGVAVSFVKKGMQTIIIDEKGLERARVDISTAVGCSVLKMHCDVMGMVGIGDYHRDEIMPTSEALSENKLKRIEKVLQDFDCGFFDALSKASNVHFLHRQALFQSCSSLSREYTAKGVVKKIQSIARSP